MAKYVPLNPDELSDDKLADLAGTLVFLMLGERALRLLMLRCVEFYAKDRLIPPRS